MNTAPLETEELRRREAELRDFFEQGAVALHWVGPDGRVLWANQAELDLLGYPAEEYIGRHIADFHADPEVIEDILRRLTGYETLREYEARLRCRDGTIKYVLISSNVLREGDRFVHTRCFTVDITARKLAERRLAVQYAITRLLAEAPTLAAAAGPMLRTVCETLGWEAGGLLTVDPADGMLRCDAFWHAPEVDAAEFAAASRARRYVLGVGLPGRVWASGQPAWLPDVLQDDNFPRGPAAARAGLHAAFACPIRLGDEVLGVMEFFSRALREPDEALLAMMAAVGSQVGQLVERERAEAALRYQLDLTRTIIDNTQSMLFMTDAEGRITFANPAVERVTGYRPEEILGRTAHEALHHLRPDGTPYPRTECPLDRALSRRATVSGHEDVFVRKDGSFVPVRCAARPILRDGAPAGTVVEIYDVSVEKQAEIALRDLVRARDEFFGAAAHDLKTPLTAIKALAQLLQRRAARLTGPERDALVEGLARLDGTTNTMVAQVNALLDVARLQAGQPLTLELEPTDLVALAQECAEQHRPLAQQHRIRVVAREASLVGPWDPRRLRRVLANLVDNAVKYSPDGGTITLTVAREEQPDGAWAMLTVRDPGVGIPAAELPRIFEPFYRASNIAGRIGGSGLGLAGIKQIVEQHGGTIAAASRPGKGATFTVRLPLGDAPRADRTGSPPRTGRVPATPPPGDAPEAQRDGR